MSEKRSIKLGDRITFLAVTRSSARKATRKVTAFTSYGDPQVRYHGWGDFIVKRHEIYLINGSAK